MIPESEVKAMLERGVAAERERCVLIIEAYMHTVRSVMPNPVAQEFCEGQVIACESIIQAIRSGQ